MSFHARGGELKVKLVLRATRQTGQKRCVAVNINRWLRLARQQAFNINHKADSGI